MKKKQVFLPAELIDMLSEVVRSEGYVALQPLFSDHQPGSNEYLLLTEQDARNLLVLADIEMQRAELRYPFTDDSDDNYDPAHEQAYDDVMLGIYEKTYYYLQSAFPALGQQG